MAKLFLAIEFAVLILIFLHDFARRYLVFTIYFATVFLGDIFWDYVGPSLGFSYDMLWYYKMFWLSDSLEHILKILVMISFYRIVLRGYHHLRLMVDCLFYGISVAILLIFLVNFNPSAMALSSVCVMKASTAPLCACAITASRPR